jgi:glucosamine--fructose-6-phosphate aminotransferase (isomerizing)
MCGIVGYAGHRECLEFLVDGLKRLEYRGYDSAGVALLNGTGVQIRKIAGKIADLEGELKTDPPSGVTGIGHTRWATHGEPTTVNAHPHRGGAGKLALVHNGIIENYATLKAKLQTEGDTFETETDTEVLAHLIEKYYEGNLEEAVGKALSLVEGTYGIAVVHEDEPTKIVGARAGSPLVVGIGDGENWVASDVSAILRHTKQVVYLDDGEMVVVTPDSYRTITIDGRHMDKEVQEVEWELEQIEKGGYDHFMLKEIFEQPDSIQNTFRGRVLLEDGTAHLGGLNMERHALRLIDRIIIIGCGTSWHSAMIGEYMIEEYAGVPVEVEYASEFRYRNPIIKPGTVCFVISQSGETIDTLAAMREAQARGAPSLGIVNVVGSTIARESDGGVYVHAGPEIGVASTKAFTSQVAALAVLTLCLGRLKNLSQEQGRRIVQALSDIPDQMRRILDDSVQIQAIAREYARLNNFLYLGRGYNFPVALEGALKLKEISYIHAEGYPAAEMKHGPIALIDENMPVVFICIQDSAYDKILSNMEEVRARKGKIIAVASEGDTQVREKADHVIYVPRTEQMLSPLLTVLPLQLLAYYIARERGCNVDQPRNLAKSVTVE